MTAETSMALGEAVVSDTDGRPTVLAQSALEAASEQGRSVNALAYLLAWLRDPSAPGLFALLGEYGMGKTITCQRLVQELELLRARGGTACRMRYT